MKRLLCYLFGHKFPKKWTHVKWTLVKWPRGDALGRECQRCTVIEWDFETVQASDIGTPLEVKYSDGY